MANKLFGIADPYYDALRVQSNQAVWPDAGGSNSGIGGGLENKIYLWPADGSTITTFDPTYAGVVAANTAAASGDSIILPSINIAMSAGITLAAGVALRGLSHNAILSFSGFSGIGITLSDNSICYGFSVSMISNGTTAIGIDAHAVGARVANMIVDAQSGSATNIAVDMGVAVAVQREFWFAITGAMFWSSNAFVDSEAAVWQGIAFPFDVDDFDIADDGSIAYVHRVTSPMAWYKVTDLKGTPVYTNISTDVVGSDDDQAIHGSCIGTSLYTVLNVPPYGSRNWKYSTYDPNTSTWAQGSQFTINQFQANPVTQSFYGFFDVYYNTNGTTLESQGGGVHVAGDGWVNSNGVKYGWSLLSATIYLRRLGVGDFENCGAGDDNGLGACRAHGAHNGPHALAVDHNGKLYAADDGTTFSNVATWKPGKAHDGNRNGGGDVLWIATDQVDSTEGIRLYSRSGWTSTDRTGNFWDVASGDFSIVGSGEVYVP